MRVTVAPRSGAGMAPRSPERADQRTAKPQDSFDEFAGKAKNIWVLATKYHMGFVRDETEGGLLHSALAFKPHLEIVSPVVISLRAPV